MAACENCGREFPVFQARAGGSRKRYCSKECAAAGKRMPPKAVECKGCGKTFVVDRAHARQVYCSEECAKGRATVECTGCGTEFTKQRCHVRAKNFCSTACRDTSAAERRTQAAKGTCETCGGPTSKKSYRQCQACSWNGKPTSGKPITEVTG